jgi:hypothetical protein
LVKLAKSPKPAQRRSRGRDAVREQLNSSASDRADGDDGERDDRGMP